MLTKCLIKWLAQEYPPSEFPMCDFDRIRYEVRQCDVLLIEGRSRISQVIKQITQSAWSHSALYIGRLHEIQDEKLRLLAHQAAPDLKPDTQLLVEGMIGKGIIITPITFYHRDHIRICRPKGLSPADAQNVIAHSLSLLGKDYDVRQIIDIARFMLPWSIVPRKWRSTLFEANVTTTTKTVCSTMIAEAFATIDFPILPVIVQHETRGLELVHRNPKLMVPKDFDHSPYFDIIKYPFLESEATYRNFPWNRDGLMSNDDSIAKGVWASRPNYKEERSITPQQEEEISTDNKDNKGKQ